MNPITCINPDCAAVLTTIRRTETKVSIKVIEGEMQLQSHSGGKLRRSPPRWLDLRYWFRPFTNSTTADRSNYLTEEFDPNLRARRRVEYHCPHCGHTIDPASFGWVDPLEVLERPTYEQMTKALAELSEEENVSPQIWQEYVRYGESPSLVLESALLLETI